MDIKIVECVFDVVNEQSSPFVAFTHNGQVMQTNQLYMSNVPSTINWDETFRLEPILNGSRIYLQIFD